jgi:hypothetical protein
MERQPDYENEKPDAVSGIDPDTGDPASQDMLGLADDELLDPEDLEDLEDDEAGYGA